MFLTVKQQLNHLSKEEYRIIKELCHTAKNLTNEALYNIRQHFFKTGKHLNYNENNRLLKTSENYRALNSNMSQQILMEVDGSFRSFFELLKRAGSGKCSFREVRIPKYLPKDGFTTLIIGVVRLQGNKLILPYSRAFRKSHKPVVITIPPILLDKKVKEIRIKPRSDARFFEIHYIYEADSLERNLNKNNALALDFGVNNLVTAVSSKGDTFLIDGRRLKSINQWYNKENARLQSIKDKQRYGKAMTKRQKDRLRVRNNRVNDYMSKTARMIIDYCIRKDIGVLVVGYNKTFQRGTEIGKVNNQNFVNIPYGLLRKKLEYLCQMNGINYVEQEESYTSKASFWDKDDIPVYGEDVAKCIFNGKRVHRGQYQCSDGKMINADVNGALNILRKSNVVSLKALYSRGDVDTPVRIRVA